MKRGIKFRLWDKVFKRMYYDGNLPDGTRVVMNIDGGLEFSDPVSWREEDFEIMQFTGMCDKNGKEIYEGDITQTVCNDGTRLSKFVISWTDGGFIKTRQDGEVYDLRGDNCAWHVVIGNVYE